MDSNTFVIHPLISLFDHPTWEMDSGLLTTPPYNYPSIDLVDTQSLWPSLHLSIYSLTITIPFPLRSLAPRPNPWLTTSTSHLAFAAILLFSLLIILYRPFQTSTLNQPEPNSSPRPVLPLLSPPLTPTMVFTTPKASPSPMSDRSVSGAPELVGSFVEKYKDIKSRYEEAQAKADKYERLYLELKVRADELAELEASLPTVKRLEAELEHEARLRQKATDELEQLKREQEELLAMQ
ncbi:uncharacterized protein CcaverHIS019_0301250 [Cutaneotrichosporon cavernicola]|uniref:Uncharacterized protein n=1 Tax=Cutaneotrichosporon cavernicola TaxID=279322 RepID=A0AA48I924_9TREE|nr:uncharacterized protein CcaverHIS019_0301250 [Cutaneotrichosporon cavernicola]BEI90055.1 hypothetical protein CcaverHIS019_0301250 [Cutaneotrichosporon cavernicola]